MKQLKLALAPLFTTYRYQTAFVWALINPVLWAMFVLLTFQIGQIVSFGMLFPNTVSYYSFQLIWPIMAIILVKSQKSWHTENNFMLRRKILRLSYFQLWVLIIWIAFMSFNFAVSMLLRRFMM